MNLPLFSIVTPTFNCGTKIATTAASVLAQEKGLYEFLIVDGGSTDDTLAHIRAFDPGALRISEPDAGIYDAMNKGIRLARGKLIYFLGAGDRLRPDILRTVAEQLHKEQDAPQFIYGDIVWPMVGGRYGGVFTPSRLAYTNISHQAIFYDIRIFDLLGEFDLRYKICADYAMNIRCFGCREIRKHHLDLIIADFEGGGVSETLDHPFYDDIVELVRQSLGLRIGLVAAYYHSQNLHWARSLNYHFHQPWGVLPAKLIRRILHHSG